MGVQSKREVILNKQKELWTDDGYVRWNRSCLSKLLFRFRIGKVIEIVVRLKAINILDVGAADCRSTSAIQRCYAGCAVFSAERSFDLLKADRSSNPRRVCADARFLPFKERTFDAVILLATLKHIFKVEKSLAEFAPVLTRKGALLIIEPTKEIIKLGSWFGFFDTANIANLWSVSQLQSALVKHGFRVVESGCFAPFRFPSIESGRIGKALHKCCFNRLSLYQYCLAERHDSDHDIA